MLSLQISSSLRDVVSEKRFQKDITVANLKGKLEVITGGTASMMDLVAYNEQNKQVCKLDNDSALLSSYPLQDNMRLHVINTDPSKVLGVFDDVSKVEKFEMDQSEYEKKADSVLAFKKRNKLGRFGDKDPQAEEQKQEEQQKEQEKANSITISSRCLVTRPGVPARKGVVMFVGLTEFASGYWIGIKYDEPFGKNDGSVKGKRYFECPPKYGAFVKPSCVETGDYPEDDLDDDDEM